MEAIKKLLEWDVMERRKALPPEYHFSIKPSKTKYTDKTANGLTKCIIRYVCLLGYQAERVSSMGRVIGTTEVRRSDAGYNYRVGKVKYIPGTSKNGTADISATIKGRSVKIEVKIGRDRQSAAQKNYQQEVERAGGIYYIAKDFQSFHDWLHNELLPKIQ